MTWEDIKLATMQKMFSADGTQIPSDDSTKDYIAAMPYAANEGILMMATAGKFVVKSVTISVNPIPNLLGADGNSIFSMVGGTKEFSASNAKSFYFETMGKCTVTIKVGETVVKTIDVDTKSYKEYKGVIDNTDNVVRLVFSSEYPYAIKSLALYGAKFVEDEEVPAYAEKIRYKMDEIVDDFHTINSIIFEGDSHTSRYVKTDEVFQEGDKVLALDRDIAGNYIVYYNALPPLINAATDDDYELPLDKEVAAILPLYMASQLYKEDDISIATQYRNEFEVAFERLQNAIPNGKGEEMTSESGWI